MRRFGGACAAHSPIEALASHTSDKRALDFERAIESVN
jgi:hypothetical protein